MSDAERINTLEKELVALRKDCSAQMRYTLDELRILKSWVWEKFGQGEFDRLADIGQELCCYNYANKPAK